MFVAFDVFAAYSSTLHPSLVRTQGFSLMVLTHNSTLLKTNGVAEDIFIFNSFWVKNLFVSGHKKRVFFHDLIKVMKIYQGRFTYRFGLTTAPGLTCLT